MDKIVYNYSCLNKESKAFVSLVFAVIVSVVITSCIFMSSAPIQSATTIYAKVRVNEDDNKTKLFLESTPLTVMDTEPPDYIPNLASPCFYEKIGLKFYKRSKATPRPGFTLRCLPRIFLAGFSKSGTTDLHYHITQHQHVYGSAFKEPHFWGQSALSRESRLLTLRHYTELFSHATSLIESCCLSHLFHDESHVHCAVSRRIDPDTRDHLDKRKQENMRRRGNHLARDIKDSIEKNGFNTHDGSLMNSENCPLMTIDSTPRYVWEAHYWNYDPANRNSRTPNILTPDKIHHTIPNAKVIIIMRNPVDRLWSDYHFYNQNLKKIKNADHFHDCVTQGIDWWNNCIATYPMEKCAYGLEYENFRNPRKGQTWEKGGADRVRIGVYYVFIKSWLEVFKSENVLLIRFEDYVKDPLAYVNAYVFPFLGLDAISQYNLKLMEDSLEDDPHLSNKKRYEMHNKTRTMLLDFYEPYNKMLSELLHEDKYLWQ